LIPNPIGKVLSILKKHRVRALLMGGQACVVYGAAEFSRDVDLAIEPSEKNLERLLAALEELRAANVFFPPLGLDVLLQGHACHFRAGIPEVEGLRVDVMSVLRGCDSFEQFLLRLVKAYHGSARRIATSRLAIQHAVDGNADEVTQALRAEEDAVRAADRAYWAPLRAELAQWRSQRARKSATGRPQRRRAKDQ
jgi:hypothetical protein